MIKKITFLAAFSFIAMQFTTAQTFFSDDFSDLDISDWTTYDVDNDSYTWGAGDFATGGAVEILEFDAVLASRSWIQGGIGALSPDNYVVSQAIDLTTAGAGLQLEYAYGTTQGAPYHLEEYSIYVTTLNNLTDIQTATAIHNEILSIAGSRQTNVIDLSAFAGQIVYLTFRHHNTFDMNMMLIDDVLIRIPVDTDAIAQSVSLSRYALINTDNQLSVDVKNNGSIVISDVEVNWNDGISDHIATISTNIAPGGTATVNHPMMVNYTTADEKNINVTVSAVNGIADLSPSDNTVFADFNTLTQAGSKAVFIEEATGTWCGFCPRGAVGMDYMSAAYPNTVVAIAVHNADPMTVPEYDTGIGQYINGYPSAAVDRKIGDVNPAAASLEAAYNIQITEVVPVDLSSNATQVGNTLTISANATFYTTFSNANYRLGVIISEDGVTGTSSGYNQTNYYSGGSLGPMGGYENLSDPVPASQMVYDHVGIALLGGFSGQAGSVPTTISNGSTASYDFNYTIPASSNVDNLHIAVVLIDGANGSIVSATQSSVAEALSVEEVSGISTIKIYPNPASDHINIAFQAGIGKYSISVTDMLGRTVINKSVEGVFGSQSVQLPISQLNAGHYIININDENATYSSKFIVSK
ncbi:T9SS type A sorting domain-containing protein [Winogradskyella sp. UBA3174]|uniref:T9SS type A sorting domain-containing protein n=1 Tax=Winogradskyella sp. UBA3174 TaxID=1947785 RepID=UPI0025E7D8ED|nr:Omp28-related outer membrane protein [Winogradskyella sp. UBA3174]|tara:strand:- start:17913 stop:19832 length:1920 start_codon:yes stop_codon:yes gene_type:complete